MRSIALIVTLTFFPYTPASPVGLTPQNVIGSAKLSGKDQLTIIKSVLRAQLTTERANRKRFSINLLANENIKPESLPNLTGVNLTLLNESQIKAKIEAGEGIRYWAINKFEVQDNRVKVWVSVSNYEAAPKCDSFVTSVYEFRKVSGRWRGKLIEKHMGVGEKAT